MGHQYPLTLFDANKGTVLQQWDALPKSELGQGPGGVTFNNSPYRQGFYQFGNLETNTNALGKSDILLQNNGCTISNNLFRVINLKNQTETQLPFDLPILKTHWVAQLEYSHNFYNNHAHANIDHRIITFNNPKGLYSSSLSGNEITVGIKYLFC